MFYFQKNQKPTSTLSKEAIPQNKNLSSKQEATKSTASSKDPKASTSSKHQTVTTSTKVSNPITYNNDKASLNNAIYSNTSTSVNSKHFENKGNISHDALDLSKKDISIKSSGQISIDKNNNINENLYENTSDLNQPKAAFSENKEMTELAKSKSDNTYENALHILQKHPCGNVDEGALESTDNEYVNYGDDEVNKLSENYTSDFIEPESFDNERKNNGIDTFIQNKITMTNNENLTNQNYIAQENNNKDVSFEFTMTAFQFNADNKNLDNVVSPLTFVGENEDFSNLPPVPPPPISPCLTMESSFPSPPPSEHLTLSSKPDDTAGDDDSCRDINEIIKNDLIENEEDLGKVDENVEFSDLNDEEVKDTRCDLLSAIREGS